MIHKIYMEERHLESFLRGEAIVIKSGSEEIHIALSDIGFDRISEMVLRAYGHRQGLPEIIQSDQRDCREIHDQIFPIRRRFHL